MSTEPAAPALIHKASHLSDSSIEDSEKQDISASHSKDPSAESTVIDPVAERRLVRKQDLRILPVIWIAYLFQFIDRTNLGNAKVAGLEKSLGLQLYDFNIGASIYFIIYFFTDIPAGLLVKKFGFWLVPFATLLFGIVTMCTAFIHTRGQFFTVRVFLGLTESFTMPGCAYLLTRYYRRSELTVRIGFFLLFSAGCSSAFGGLLASGLLSLPAIGSLDDKWRNIFLVEGIITIGVALILFIIFPADPSKTRIFNEQERQLSKARFFADQPAVSQHKEAISFKLIKKALISPVTLACIWLYICNNITVQGLSIFTVSILRVIYPGKTTVQIQLYSVPPPVVGVAFALAMCYIAQRTKRHGLSIMFSVSLAIIGYALWYHFLTNAKIRYTALFLTQMGGFAYGPLVLGWAAANASPDTVRAVTVAAVTGLSSIGSITGTWSYINTDAKNGYSIGNRLNLATGSSVFVIAGLLSLYMVWENRARASGKRNDRLQEKDVDTLGSRHPEFRYIY